MVKNEIYKFFVKQKAAVWVLLFVLLKMISAVYLTLNCDTRPTEVYNEYLCVMGGRLNEEKSAYIEEKYQELIGVPADINDLEEQVADGTLESREYAQKVQQYSKRKQEESEIRLFYQKYLYALENPERHYIVDEDGWSSVLATEKVDFLLILAIFLIAIPVYCNEYETEMDWLQRCSRNGRSRLTAIKLALVSGVCGGMSVFSVAVDYLRLKSIYGMKFGNAPIQSLEFFEKSELSFSLWQLFLLISIIKVVGYLFLGIFILGVSILLHQSLLTIIAGGAMTLLPMVVSSNIKVKYLLPFPAGLMYAVGYFFPDQYSYQLVSSDTSLDLENIQTFEQFTNGQRFYYFLVIAIVMVFLVAYIFKGFDGRKMFRIRKVKVICFLVMLLLVSGCGKVAEVEEKFCENSRMAGNVKNDNYYFYIEENNIVALDLETQEKKKLIRDPFVCLDESEKNFSLFATNCYLYYGMMEEEEFVISRINLENFREEKLYRKKSESGENLNLAIVTDNFFYVYGSSRSEFYEIERKNGTWTSLGILQELFTGDYGKKLYYQNQNSQLVERDVETGEVKVYEDVCLRSQYSTKNGCLCICGDDCYYTNLIDHDYIYRYSFSTGENRLLLKENAIVYLEANQNELYYEVGDGSWYCMNLESGKIEECEGML